jgi:hypothetical protein
MMSEGPEFDKTKFVRILNRHTISLTLDNDCLKIKVRLRESHPSYYITTLTSHDLPPLLTVLFDSISEFYKELKCTKDSNLSFTENGTLIYSISLAIKKIELPFQLQEKQISREEELTMDNDFLRRIKADYEVILRAREK